MATPQKTPAQEKHSRVIPVFLHNSALIPTAELRRAGFTDKDVEETFKPWAHRFYENPSKCASCYNFDNRHNHICDECDNHQWSSVLAKEIQDKSGVTYASYPLGDNEKLRDLKTVLSYAGLKLKGAPMHPDAPIKPFKLLVPLREHQSNSLEAVLTHRRGIVKAPPRSGKTLSAISVVQHLKQKTLIIAHQRDWLHQFMDTFYGGEHQDRLTDIAQGRAKICKTLKDFKTTDICLATPQQFMSIGGKKLLDKIRSMFHIVLCDEVQRFPAKATSLVLSAFNTAYIIGYSGTPERKHEATMNVAHDLIGPVIIECEVERLPVKMAVLETKIRFRDPRSKPAFTALIKDIEHHPQRLELIARTALHYKDKGHTVIITLTRVTAIKALTELINRLDTTSPQRVAAAFGGWIKGKQRTSVLNDVKSGEVPILVGIASLVSVGLNIPRASLMIDAILSNNPPNCDQRLSRILTPFPGKPSPIYVRVLDVGGVVSTCFRNEYFNCILPRHKPKLLPSASNILQREYD